MISMEERIPAGGRFCGLSFDAELYWNARHESLLASRLKQHFADEAM